MARVLSGSAIPLTSRLTPRFTGPNMIVHQMSKPQRVVLIVYCVLLAYSCLWIPWRVPKGGYTHMPTAFERLGYGFAWVGPSTPNYLNLYATPDMPLIALRVFALSAVAAAALLLVWKLSTTTASSK
jgi:hypothetical protein